MTSDSGASSVKARQCGLGRAMCPLRTPFGPPEASSSSGRCVANNCPSSCEIKVAKLCARMRSCRTSRRDSRKAAGTYMFFQTPIEHGRGPRENRRMASLSILNASGDSTIRWDERAFAAGDPEAQAAVTEAERLFAEARAAGGEAFRLQAGSLAHRVATLDPTAGDDVLVVPRMVGG